MSDKERIAALEAGVRQLADMLRDKAIADEDKYHAAKNGDPRDRAYYDGTSDAYMDAITALDAVFAPLGITGEGEGAGDVSA